MTINMKKLHEWRKANLYRKHRVLNTPQGVNILCDDKPCLSFCSNDYLGLANHPTVVSAMQIGAAKYGVGSGASKLISGYSQAHMELEHAFAEFLQREATLLFSTGYMANLGVLTSLFDKNDLIFEDRENHASLIDGGLFSKADFHRYKHLDLLHLESQLQKHTTSSQKLIVTDGVFSMSGDIAPLSDIAKLAKKYHAAVMVDDAHGIGILGKHGRGSLELYHLNEEDVPILVSPLGKAFGCFGAIVAGSKDLIDSLTQFARSYMYTTGLPPAIAHASLASLNIIQKEPWRREKLLELISYFRQAAKAREFNFIDSDTPIQSLIIGDVEVSLKVSQELFNAGFLVRAMRPPTVPPKTSRLRITLNSQHTTKQIDNLLDTLTHVLKTHQR